MGAVIAQAAKPEKAGTRHTGTSRIQPLKRCTYCGAFKSVEEFSGNVRKDDGLDSHCRQCTRKRMREKKARQLAQGLCTSCGSPRGDSQSRRCCQKCLTRDSGTRRSREMRATVIQAYGGESPFCFCCGEKQAAFLTLDHVDGGGCAHRRVRGNQSDITSCEGAATPRAFRSSVSTATWRGASTARVLTRAKPR